MKSTCQHEINLSASGQLVNKRGIFMLLIYMCHAPYPMSCILHQVRDHGRVGFAIMVSRGADEPKPFSPTSELL
eukprot:4187123-Amphidinium_carterae.2